jgi:hypothetical protein
MIKIGFSDPQLMAHFVAFNEACGDYFSYWAY